MSRRAAAICAPRGASDAPVACPQVRYSAAIPFLLSGFEIAKDFDRTAILRGVASWADRKSRGGYERRHAHGWRTGHTSCPVSVGAYQLRRSRFWPGGAVRPRCAAEQPSVATPAGGPG